MIKLLNTLVSGLGLGAIYGLVALGFTLIFKSTGILNFAHGNFMVIGAFLTAVFASLGLGFWPAVALSLLVVAAVGAVTHLVVLRKLVAKGLFAGVMATIGIAEILSGASGIAFGYQQKVLPTPLPTRSLSLGGQVSVNASLAVAGVVLVVVVLILNTIFRRTLLGTQLKALGEDSHTALLVGGNPNLLFAVTWAIAAALGAIAGGLLGAATIADHEIQGFGLRAFTAVIVGGIESLPGALLGGLFVGITEMAAGAYLGSEWRLPVTMMLLMIFLLARPNGLLGMGELKRA